MKTRRFGLTGLLWTLKNKGIFEVCKHIDVLRNNVSAVLTLEKRKVDSDFIILERTSEKCFRISGIAGKASFPKADLAYDYIIEQLTMYFQAMADYNKRIGIDNSQYVEKLNRLKGGIRELPTFQK